MDDGAFGLHEGGASDEEAKGVVQAAVPQVLPDVAGRVERRIVGFQEQVASPDEVGQALWAAVAVTCHAHELFGRLHRQVNGHGIEEVQTEGGRVAGTCREEKAEDKCAVESERDGARLTLKQQ